MNECVWINGGLILRADNQGTWTNSHSSATLTIPFEFICTDVVYQNRTTKYDYRYKQVTPLFHTAALKTEENQLQYICDV